MDSHTYHVRTSGVQTPPRTTTPARSCQSLGVWQAGAKCVLGVGRQQACQLTQPVSGMQAGLLMLCSFQTCTLCAFVMRYRSQ